MAEPSYHRPIPPTPPRRPRQEDPPQVHLEDDLRESQDDTLTLPVEKQGSTNSPTSVNYVSSNRSPKPILKRQEPSQVVQLTGYCTHCAVPILYTPMADSETLVKCYNCPTVNSFAGGGEGFGGEEAASPVTSPRGDGAWNSKVKGAFKTMKSSNFMKAAAEKTASAAATAKVAAQKASATTKVAAQKASATTKVVAQKASQTTKEAAQKASQTTKEAAQKAKHSLQRANSQIQEDENPNAFKPAPPNSLKSSGEVAVPEVTRIFGIPLEDAVQKSSTQVECVPDIVVSCIEFIRHRAIKEEGIFRISGSQQTVKEYKLAFDRGENPDLNAVNDEHVVSGLLKLYFRELPNPLFTMALGPEFRSLERLPEPEMIPKLGPLVHRLPKVNFTVLRMLLELLVEVNMHESENKMTVQNLGIVFAPTLGCPMEVIGPMIKNYDQVFNFDLIQF